MRKSGGKEMREAEIDRIGRIGNVALAYTREDLHLLILLLLVKSFDITPTYLYILYSI